MTNYLIAGSKPWTEQGYYARQHKLGRPWKYVRDPESLNERLSHNLNPKYIFFLHWNWRVPKEIYDNYECICFHMTNVPYGRGGSPLQNLIVEKNKTTVLTALKMDETLDGGAIYTQRAMSLNGSAEEIYSRATDISFEIIDWIIETEPTPVAQKGEPTYFKRRTPEQSELPLEDDLESLYDFIRMLDANTYPRAFLNYGNFRFEFAGARQAGNQIEAKVFISPRLKNK